MGKEKKDRGAGAIIWMDQPEEHNYPAAESYLKLVLMRNMAAAVTSELRDVEVTHFKAKDIFRASGLSLLGVSNSHVDKNTEKIEAGKALSPILLVSDHTGRKVIVADGYHRLCAVYHYDEDASVPCKIVDL